jgi:hypothetical protein
MLDLRYLCSDGFLESLGVIVVLAILSEKAGETGN